MTFILVGGGVMICGILAAIVAIGKPPEMKQGPTCPGKHLHGVGCDEGPCPDCGLSVTSRRRA